jgi:transcriptional regulator with XRE-family HTH domain
MSEKIQKKFGRAVKKRRLQANLSQEKLAEKIGFHRTYISMIERGEKTSRLEISKS